MPKNVAKILIDVHATKSGDGFKRTMAEANDLRLRIAQATKTAVESNGKWVRSSDAAARKIADNLKKIEIAAGRASRAQAGLTGAGGVRPSSGARSAAGGNANFAGVGLLNMLSKAPGGQVWAPIAGLTGAIGGIGKAAAAIGVAVVAVKALEAAVGMAWRASTGLLKTFFDLTVQGYNYNAMLQTTRAGTAAIISSFADIIDMTGKTIEGSKKFDAAMMISASIQARLRAAAVQTAASYEELVRVFQEGAAPAITKGFDASDITRLTIDIAQVAQAIGLPFEQLNQEIRGLLEGDMSRNSRIARIILADLREEAQKAGTTVEQELQRMAKLGTLPDYLSERMREFNKAAAVTASTLPVALSNLRDAFQTALGAATAGGVGSVTSRIQALTNSIVSFDQFGNAQFGKGFREALGAMASLMEKLIKFALDLTLKFDELYFKASEFVKLSPREQISKTLQTGLDKVPWWAKQIVPGAGLLGAVGKFIDPSASGAGAAYDRLRDAGQINLPGQPRQNFPMPGASLTMEQRWQAELERRRAAEMAAASNQIRKGRMLLGSGYNYKGEEGKLSSQSYQIKGMDVDNFYQQVGRVLQEGNPMAILSMIDGINKAIKDDGIVNLEEFNKALLNAGAGGYEIAKGMKEANEEIDKASKIQALTNKFETLAATARSAAEAMRDIAQRANGMSIDLGKEIVEGRHAQKIDGLRSEISTIEMRAGGDMTVADIRAIEAIEHRIIEEERLIALMRARTAAAERQAKITDLEADAETKLTAIKKAQADLKELLAARSKSKMGSSDRARIDAEVEGIELSIRAGLQLYTEAQDKIDLLRAQSAELLVVQETTAATTASAAHVDAAAESAKKQQDINDKKNKEIRRQETRLIRELQREWEKFGDVLGRSFARAFEEVSTGGSIKGAFEEITAGIRDIIGGALQQTVSDWWSSMSSVAAGKHPDDPRFPATESQQRNAKRTQGGVIALSAAYGIWNQRGATRGQNVLGGAMQGASAGMSIGMMSANPYGAIIGAVIGLVVGGIMGAFAPTGGKVGMRISSGPMGLRVVGSGDAKQYQVTEAISQINAEIRRVRESMYDILFGLPTHVLTSLTANLQPNLPDFDKKIDAVTGAEDAIRDFITNQIPKLTAQAYIPAIQQMALLLGVSKAKTDELVGRFRTQGVDTEAAIKLVKEFFDSIARLQEVMVGGVMNTRDRMRYATDRANKPVQQQLAESASRITALIPKDFGRMSIEDQTAYAQRLLPLIEARYEMELNYLAQIDAAMKSSLQAIDDQIFELEMEDKTPQQQMDELLSRNRAIIDALATANTPEEIQRLQSQYQENIGRMVQIGGNRPEDRQQAIAALENFRGLVEGRYNAIIDQVEAAGNAYYAQIQRILDALETGLSGILPGTGTPPIDPSTGQPWQPLPGGPLNPRTIEETNEGLKSVGDAASIAGAAWRSQFGDGTTGIQPVPEPEAEGKSQTVVVQVTPTPVVFQGDIGRFVHQARVDAVNESVTRTVQVMERRSRRRSGGRR